VSPDSGVLRERLELQLLELFESLEDFSGANGRLCHRDTKGGRKLGRRLATAQLPKLGPRLGQEADPQIDLTDA
jgi:hypothetical protein